ncbi:unnamed protein product [Auanema sp. JU1783]|nr:unnamed protein product [Auanema sp. JU1783]
MAFPPTAGRGVTQVIERCESAKTTAYLDLSNCCLIYIADAIYLVLKGYEINKISVRENSLKKFPKKFLEKFPNTTIFNMEGNEVSEFPEEFATWLEMKAMNMSKNKIEKFPEGIYSMSKLVVLDLSANQIEELDVEKLYDGCPNLIQLNLAGNPLKDDIKKALENSPKKPAKLSLLI